MFWWRTEPGGLFLFCFSCFLKFEIKELLCILYTGEPPLTEWEYLPPVGPRPLKGFVGLKNAGATCYMNSVLQQVSIVLDQRLFYMFLPKKFVYVIFAQSGYQDHLDVNLAYHTNSRSMYFFPSHPCQTMMKFTLLVFTLNLHWLTCNAQISLRKKKAQFKPWLLRQCCIFLHFFFLKLKELQFIKIVFKHVL